MADQELLKTAIHGKHAAAGASMGDEAGWQVPLSFTGAAAEVAQVRRQAGVFDVSHIARFRVRGNEALDLLERLCTADVAHQEDDTAMRTLICNESGCIMDECFLLRLGGEWLLTCSPPNRQKLWRHIEALAGGMDVKISDQTARTAQVAVAGPRAAACLDAVLPESAAALARGGLKMGSLVIARYIAMRTGYTGEWSLEVIVPNTVAGQAWRFITQKAGENCLPPIGMAARDILRIEAGLRRYARELNETIDPIMAGLEELVDFEHDFLGRQAVLQIAAKGVTRKLAGLAGQPGRAGPVPRLGSTVSRPDGSEAGSVTSGTFSPTLDRTIAMAYLATDVTESGTELHVAAQDVTLPMRTTSLPFHPAQPQG